MTSPALSGVLTIIQVLVWPDAYSKFPTDVSFISTWHVHVQVAPAVEIMCLIYQSWQPIAMQGNEGSKNFGNGSSTSQWLLNSAAAGPQKRAPLRVLRRALLVSTAAGADTGPFLATGLAACSRRWHISRQAFRRHHTRHMPLICHRKSMRGMWQIGAPILIILCPGDQQ